MALFNLTHGLNRDDQPVAHAAARTHVGQARFAGSGPPHEICRNCESWQFVKQWFAAGGPKPSRCAQYFRMMRSWGPNVPHDARACKYFCQRDAVIPLVRPEKVT